MTAPSLPRSAGVLLPPTSLPGPFGIGDLGPIAHRWVETLAGMRQSWWQVLPLGPTGYADSPYQSFSSFAGNVNLLSPDLLVADDLLQPSDLEGAQFPESFVDYAAVIPFKRALLRHAWERFPQAVPLLRAEFDEFRERESAWLEDFALFLALKDANQGRSWSDWPRAYAHRNAAALARAKVELADS